MKQVKQGTPEPFAALNRIPIAENREPLVDIRLVCPKIIVNRGVLPYVRTGIAEMLNQVQALLPPGHRLKIHSALRTIETQSELYWRNYKQRELDHPTWPKSALRRANNKFFAAPDVKAPPGHCTGGAVDVTIVGPDGKNLDMTSPTKGWEAAYTYSTNLSKQALANRRLLIESMFAVGFSNCRDEWWHYSYGDNAWAVRTGNRIAFYGHIRPPDGHSYALPHKPKTRVGRIRPLGDNLYHASMGSVSPLHRRVVRRRTVH
jgi:D-alanyl-D-alanine dipeptidase